MVIFIIAFILLMLAIGVVFFYIANYTDFISNLTDDDIKDDDWIV